MKIRICPHFTLHRSPTVNILFIPINLFGDDSVLFRKVSGQSSSPSTASFTTAEYRTCLLVQCFVDPPPRRAAGEEVKRFVTFSCGVNRTAESSCRSKRGLLVYDREGKSCSDVISLSLTQCETQSASPGVTGLPRTPGSRLNFHAGSCGHV